MSATLVEVILRRLNFCKLHPARIRIASTTITSSSSAVIFASIFVSIDHHLRVAALRVWTMLVMFWPSRRRIVKVMEAVTYVVVVVGANAAAVDVVVIRAVVKRVMVVVVDVVVVVKVIVVHLPERIRLS